MKKEFNIMVSSENKMLEISTSGEGFLDIEKIGILELLKHKLVVVVSEIEEPKDGE
jgi:hypothetical protein